MNVPLNEIGLFETENRNGSGPWGWCVLYGGRGYRLSFESLAAMMRHFDEYGLPAECHVDPATAFAVRSPAQMAATMAHGQSHYGDDLHNAPVRPGLETKYHVLCPVVTQEVWAAGVTYQRSRQARREESLDGGDCYDRVYDAPRPELFWKANPRRCVGPGAEIAVRCDSDWNVPEPELTLVVTPAGKLFGLTVGNDVSSRSIEGANPLYLPQAKVYQGSAALGPTITLARAVPDPYALTITLVIRRGGAEVYHGQTSTAQLKRRFDELVAYLFTENDFPEGVFLMTGTGIVPEAPFTLEAGDTVEITIDGIGRLVNPVRRGQPRRA